MQLVALERGELNNEVSSLASEIGSEHIDDELDDEEKEPRMSVKVLQKDQLHDVEYIFKKFWISIPYINPLLGS